MKKGFTLIELLIVISIIGILAAVSIFGLQGARESSRDAKRKSDLESIRGALELYRADCDVYPTPASGTVGTTIVGNGTNCPATNVYMQDVPLDPLGGGYAYNRLTNTTYTLCSILEDPPSVANNTTNCAMCSGGTCAYRVVSP